MIQSVSLSEPRRRLIRMIEEAHFGAIEHMLIKDGEPIFGPQTIMVRDRKFGKRDNPVAHDVRESPISKAQFEQLFQEFSDIGNGEVTSLEFQNGLPFKLRIRQPLVA
ncbi:MAG: hypothetical protein M1305_05120 [Candidatus Marsarchaeota archaeon]|nr:hypothetical protein [Candidatus Marsarchaeota archaeon]